ncbi:MAG: lamin tail domain-containing protein, partial [Planctomycetales bacterium]|nr:lamin tail domain-containing protein [Planctomycetales bacterium]
MSGMTRPVRRIGRRIHSLESLEDRRLLAVSPIITEFMASNHATLVDSKGNSSDWIEIHNPDSQPVDLNGWHLSDKESDLSKWTFPNVTIPANGYLVVFASGDNVAVAGSELHTNFKLSESGEFLALVAPDGSTISTAFAPEYPPQVTDVSYGLSQDGVTVGYFTAPTPGSVNGAEPVSDQSRQVVISELMYHPSSEIDAEEFIELRNNGAAAVDVTGWQFNKGVDFVFPAASIPAVGYLVVAADLAAFSAKYPGV